MLTSEFTDEYQDWLDGTPGIQRGARWLQLTLGEMAHDPVLRVSAKASVAEVVGAMAQHHQSAVLVLDGRHLDGIFTERDLVRVTLEGRDVARTAVGDVMTREPHVLSESTLLSAALRVLALGSYHHLPVIDARGEPKAMVSLQSIVSFLVDVFPHEILNAPPERESFPPVNEGA